MKNQVIKVSMSLLLCSFFVSISASQDLSTTGSPVRLGDVLIIKGSDGIVRKWYINREKFPNIVQSITFPDMSQDITNRQGQTFHRKPGKLTHQTLRTSSMKHL